MGISKSKFIEKVSGKQTLPTNSRNNALPAVISSKLEKTLLEIEKNVLYLKGVYELVQEKSTEVKKIKTRIAMDLIYVDERKDELLALKNISFNEYLASIDISKSFYYETKQAYELCIEYGKQELLAEIDTKILVGISRVENKKKQKNLLDKAQNLTREEIAKVRLSDSQNRPLNKTYKNMDKSVFNADLTKFLRGYFGSLTASEKASLKRKILDIIDKF